MNRSILDAFTIFPFAIVLALALGEAFKSVIAEGGAIDWGKRYALASFLLLILPFYQGMNKYLLLTYGQQATLSRPHSIFLIIDGTAFMIESALFFLMSRTLGLNVWQRFYWIVFALLVVDSVWGATVWMHASADATAVILRWVILNIVTVIAIYLLIRGFPAANDEKDRVPAVFGAIGMLVRTIVDYWNSWDFYFPISEPGWVNLAT
jgi:hypothetical protein